MQPRNAQFALTPPAPMRFQRHRYLPQAAYVAGKMVLALRQRGLPPVFEKFILTETGQAVWLIGVLDTRRIGKIDPYGSRDTLHQISTLASGLPTIWSNTTGVRYAVLLSGNPELPRLVPYPDAIPPDVQPLGMSLHGSINASYQQLRNVLVTGTQGSGKSVFLSGLANVALQNGYLVYLVDPEQHTFSPEMWERLTGTSVAYDEEGLLDIVDQISAELQRRGELFRDVADQGRLPNDLDAYNQLAAEPLPRIVLVVDEANDFFDNNAVVDRLTTLARHGRKWGLNIILAAHNWRAKDVPRGLSGRFPSRIAFRVDDNTSARVVLDDAQLGRRAMRLSAPGRGLIRMEGLKPQVFQAYFLGPEQEARWQTEFRQITPAALPRPSFSKQERGLIEKALAAYEGRVTLATAQEEMGMSEWNARKLIETWRRRDWLEKDAQRDNAHYITPLLQKIYADQMETAGSSQTG